MRDLRRILIVDDDPALRHSLAEQLEQHGEFEVVELPVFRAPEEIADRQVHRGLAIILDPPVTQDRPLRNSRVS